MRKSFIAAAVLALAATAAAAQSLCFFQYETVSGLLKTCVYRCASGAASITIQSHQLCPLNITR